MIGKNQVFVRAVDSKGAWGNVDVLDLEEESFKRFILHRLSEFNLVVSVAGKVDDRPLKTKTSIMTNKHPCPFCNKTDLHIVIYQQDNETVGQVECLWCRARGPVSTAGEPSLEYWAYRAWNKRLMGTKPIQVDLEKEKLLDEMVKINQEAGLYETKD